MNETTQYSNTTINSENAKEYLKCENILRLFILLTLSQVFRVTNVEF